MKLLARLLALLVLFLPAAPAIAQSILNAATAPASRAVSVGHTATYFAILANSDPSPLDNCRVSKGANLPGSLSVSFQTTNPDNTLSGVLDAPFEVPGSGSQNLVVFVSSSQPFSGRVPLNFTCGFFDQFAAFVYPDVNDLIFTARAAPGPDIIAIGQTLTLDGIAVVDPTSRLGLQTVAGVNIGSAGEVTVSADLSGFETFDNLQVIGCETNAAGACLNALSSSFLVNFGADETKFFSWFVVTPEGYPLPFAPQYIRFRTRFGVPGPEIGSGGAGAVFNDPVQQNLDAWDEISGGSTVTARSPADFVPPPSPQRAYEMVGRTEGDAQGRAQMSGYVVFGVDITEAGIAVVDQTDRLTAIGVLDNFDEFFEPFDHVFRLEADITAPSHTSGLDHPASGGEALQANLTFAQDDSSGHPGQTVEASVSMYDVLGPGPGPGPVAVVSWVADFISPNNFFENGSVILVPVVPSPNAPTDPDSSSGQDPFGFNGDYEETVASGLTLGDVVILGMAHRLNEGRYGVSIVNEDNQAVFGTDLDPLSGILVGFGVLDAVSRHSEGRGQTGLDKGAVAEGQFGYILPLKYAPDGRLSRFRAVLVDPAIATGHGLVMNRASPDAD